MVRRELSLILRFGNHLCAWSLKLRERESTQVYIAKLEPKKNSIVRDGQMKNSCAKSSFANKKSGFAAKVLKSE